MVQKRRQGKDRENESINGRFNKNDVTTSRWVDLKLGDVKKKLSFSIKFNPTFDSMELIFGDKEGSTEDFTGYGMECRDPKGVIVSHYLTAFSSQRQTRFELATNLDGVTLIVEKNKMDVSFWIKGERISESKDSQHDVPFVTNHNINGKTIGYTIRDFETNREAINYANIEIQVE